MHWLPLRADPPPTAPQVCVEHSVCNLCHKGALYQNKTKGVYGVLCGGPDRACLEPASDSGLEPNHQENKHLESLWILL